MHKKENIHNAPENTSLQRKLKEFIIAGGNMDIKYGYKKYKIKVSFKSHKPI